MILYEEIPQKILNKRNLWGAKRDAWWIKTKKEEERYYQDVEGTGTDFTVEQLKRIKNEGSNIPVTINKLYHSINQKLAILVQAKPSFKAVSLDGRTKEFAHAIDKAVKSIMYKSEAIGEEEEAIKNMLTLGMGINGIEEKDEYQFGTFNLCYENFHPTLIILDANAKKRSLKDMSGYFVEKEVPIEEAKKKYQYILDKINEMGLSSDNVTMENFVNTTMYTPVGQGKIATDMNNDKVTMAEYYDKYYTEMYFMEGENGDIQRIFRENLEPEQDFILSNAIEVEKNTYVRKHVILGNKLVAVEMKPIKDFAIKVKFFEWGGGAYASYGMIHFTIGMQEAYDKGFQNFLINGMLTNNAGYISPKMGIAEEDKPKWEKQGNRPGAIKEFVPTVIGDQVFIPKREEVQQLPNFYPIMLQMLEQGIQSSTGVNDIVSGDPKANIDVFSSLQQYQNAAMQRIQLTMSHINLANEQLGNVVIDYLLANLNLNQNYVFFDEDNSFNELKIVKENVRDFKLGRYGILSISSEAMPTQKLAMATELMKISQTTQDPMRREIYVQKAFELSDMRGFDDVKEKIDVAEELQGKLQQAQTQIERDQELLKQMENRVINAELKAKIAAELANVQSDISSAGVEAEKDITIEKLKTQLKEAQSPKTE